MSTACSGMIVATGFASISEFQGKQMDDLPRVRRHTTCSSVAQQYDVLDNDPPAEDLGHDEQLEVLSLGTGISQQGTEHLLR